VPHQLPKDADNLPDSTLNQAWTPLSQNPAKTTLCFHEVPETLSWARP
jgi:hypothetical protein